jgi:hypothetical protein
MLDKFIILKTWYYVLCAVFFHYFFKKIFLRQETLKEETSFGLKLKCYTKEVFCSYHTFQR